VSNCKLVRIADIVSGKTCLVLGFYYNCYKTRIINVNCNCKLLYGIYNISVMIAVVIGNKMFSMDSRAGSSVEYFSLIDFSNVPESYSALSDVVCCFTRAPYMLLESADYVAIFRVGWKSVDEFVCSQPVDVSAKFETSSLCTHFVTFPGRYIV